MPIFFRRFASVMAALIFLAVAPLLVLEASGYRWAGWSQKFVPTGAILISSTPKATVYLNGQPRGESTKRLARLFPGTYQLELRRSGYSQWQRNVRVIAGQAIYVGPVVLWPETVKTSTIGLAPMETAIASTDGQYIWTVNQAGDRWQLRGLYPNKTTATWSLTSQPQLIWRSPDGNYTVVKTESGVSAWALTQAEPLLQLPQLTTVKWSSESSSIAFALQDSAIKTIDFDRRITTDFVNQAAAMDVINDTVWFTTGLDGKTTLWRQAAFGQTTPRFVTMFDGPIEFLSSAGDGAAIRQTTGRQTTIVRIDQVSGQTVLQGLGPVDQWWWSKQTQPLWTRGVDLWTLNKAGQPTLVERSVAEIKWAAWAIAAKAIAFGDQSTLRIRQFEPALGSPLLSNYALPATAQLVGTWFNTKQNAYLVTDPAPAILLVSWSPTVDKNSEVNN